MSPEAQRIAIAESCGAKSFREEEYPHRTLWTFGEIGAGEAVMTEVDLPDYLNDLNAMHEAEKTLLTGDGWKDRLAKYSSKLMAVIHDTDFGRIDVAFKNDMVHLRYFTLHATSEQRAEAFLRVKNLWKD